MILNYYTWYSLEWHYKYKNHTQILLYGILSSQQLFISQFYFIVNFFILTVRMIYKFFNISCRIKKMPFGNKNISRT